jgi:hypothetical protein
MLKKSVKIDLQNHTNFVIYLVILNMTMSRKHEAHTSWIWFLAKCILTVHIGYKLSNKLINIMVSAIPTVFSTLKSVRTMMDHAVEGYLVFKGLCYLSMENPAAD